MLRSARHQPHARSGEFGRRGHPLIVTGMNPWSCASDEDRQRDPPSRRRSCGSQRRSDLWTGTVGARRAWTVVRCEAAARTGLAGDAAELRAGGEPPPAHPTPQSSDFVSPRRAVCRKGGSVMCGGHGASNETRLRPPRHGRRRAYRSRGAPAVDERRAHDHRDGSRLLTHAIEVVGADGGQTLVARPQGCSPMWSRDDRSRNGSECERAGYRLLQPFRSDAWGVKGD
jgi:hypothetical protein